MPSNYTPGTATVISALPYTVTEDVSGSVSDSTYIPSCDSGAIHFPVWFTYTPPTGVTALGFHFNVSSAGGSYDPVLTVWQGTPPSLTLVSTGVTGGTDSCFEIWDSNGGYASLNVVPATAYYFQITDDSGTADRNLLFEVVGSPALSASLGSLVISNDQPFYPAVVLSPSDASVLQVLGLPSFEMASWLPDGTLAVAAETLTNANVVASINIYSSQLALLDTVTSVISGSPESTGPLTSNQSSNFYWVKRTGSFGAWTQVLRRIAKNGTVDATSWDLSASAGAAGLIGGTAVTTDDGLLYFTRDPHSGGTQFAVGKYDLNASSFISWIVGPTGTLAGSGRDLLLLADGSLLFFSSITAGGQAIYNYSTAGTLLHTYTISSGGVPRLQGDPTDDTVFWVMLWPSGTNGGDPVHFQKIRLTDGVVLADLTNTIVEPGYTGQPQFGPSQSCPLLLNPLSLVPPIPATITYPIRRLRRFMLPWDNENKLKFISRFELILQAGIGDLVTTSPTVMFRYSKDGGLTWSTEVEMTAGAMGEYQTRVYTTRLGSGRNWVFEVTVSDPVNWQFIQASVDVEQGTS